MTELMCTCGHPEREHVVPLDGQPASSEMGFRPCYHCLSRGPCVTFTLVREEVDQPKESTKEIP